MHMTKQEPPKCCETLLGHIGLRYTGLSLSGKKDLRNANRNEHSRGRSLLPGHGTFSTSKVGGWRLAVIGGWWRLVVPVEGVWRLAVGGG